MHHAVFKTLSFSAAWLWCVRVWISLHLSLGFGRLRSVSLSLLPTLRSFQPSFLQTFFSALHSFSPTGTLMTWVLAFVALPHRSEASSPLLQSTFCGSSWINSTDSSSNTLILLSYPFCYWVHLLSTLSWQFYFSVLNFPFASSLATSLLRLSIFPFASKVFVLIYWIIFIMPVLKALSDNSNICVISVSLPVECYFPCKLRFSWSFVCQLSIHCIIDILNITL